MRSKNLKRRKESSADSSIARRPSRVFSDRVVTGTVCIFLATIVWITFGQTLGHEFVNYDDNEYVYENPKITNGLTLAGIGWAFTHVHSANWHPLTTISHMLDCQFYQLNPWGHHLTNILLHAAAAIFLFLAFKKLTGMLWASGFVAAVFAVHPLRVESVAWVSERKDVLGGIFFALTLLAYAHYARSQQRSWVKYIAVLVLFALGLMCKPTLVTLPFVLLILDYWPLCRMQSAKSEEQRRQTENSGVNISSAFQRFSVSVFEKWSVVRSLIIEKIPLLVVSAASCVATVLAQRHALEATSRLDFAERLGNAAVSYVAYLIQTIYPARLAVFYPYQTDNLKGPEVILALLLLLIISLSVFISRKKYPFLLVGWLWFLGMLVPMIGLVQVGSQARADRYTYLPQIGLCILLTWGVTELFASWHWHREVLAVAGLLVVTALVARSYDQTSYWQNSTTLWNHAIETTSHNYVAYNNLGNVLLQNGRLEEAIAQYKKASQIQPNFVEVQNNLGNALLQKGDIDEAIDHYQEAIKANPNYAEAYCSLSNALFQKGQSEEGMVQLKRALEIKPDYAEAHNNMGVALMQKGELDAAIGHYEKAIEDKPAYAQAENNLGDAFLRKGAVDEAIVHLRRALQIKPDYAEAENDEGTAFMLKGRIDDAVSSYLKAVQIKPDSAQAHNNLANALLQNGKVDGAIAHYQKALEIQPGAAEVDNNLGNAFVRKGKWADAIASYQTAVRIQPDYAQAHKQLGVSLAAIGKTDEALDQFKQALRLDKNYPEAHCDLGRLLARLGRRNEAVVQLTEALRLKPDYSDAKEQLQHLGVPESP